MTFRVPERYRVTGREAGGDYATTAADGNNGLFFFNFGSGKIRVLASDGGGWEHVSVSLAHRCPSWDEMCRIKALFWDDDDAVMQLHPRKSDYVSYHAFCLHLWRPNDGREIPLPHHALVGPKKGQTVTAAINELRESEKPPV